MPALTSISSFITLSRPFLTFHLKITNKSFYHSAHVLWNSLPSDPVRHVANYGTPSPKLNSPVSDISNYLFLKILKTHVFHSSFSVFCICLGYLRTDICSIDQTLLFLISYSFRYHNSHFIHANLYYIWRVSMNK